MNRKMTDFALAAKCGLRGAMGLMNFVLLSAAVALPAKKPSRSSRLVRANPVKPAPVSHRNSRRVRPENCRLVVIEKLRGSHGSCITPSPPEYRGRELGRGGLLFMKAKTPSPPSPLPRSTGSEGGKSVTN